MRITTISELKQYYKIEEMIENTISKIKKSKHMGDYFYFCDVDEFELDFELNIFNLFITDYDGWNDTLSFPLDILLYDSIEEYCSIAMEWKNESDELNKELARLELKEKELSELNRLEKKYR